MLLKAAMSTARAEDKFILVSFDANWCRPCLELNTILLDDPKVAPIVRERFVIVKMNIGNYDKNAAASQRFQLDLSKLVVPRILILEANGNVLAGGSGQQPVLGDTIGSDQISVKLRRLTDTLGGRTKATGDSRQGLF